MKFGLFLNAGEFPGMSHDAIYDLLVSQAELADQLGYHDLWITEHHFIPFGINSSALAAAAFLLGHTQSVRVGTAVVLAPQYHPVQLAEQTAILDQFSRGRFDLGIGRGGYLRDFEVFGTPLDRYDREVEATIRTLLDAWDGQPLPNAGGTAPP
ncbi:MAG: LLM class flavin-dependent oxidoreductase, partial [Dehalococcoidia bacterium]